LVAAFHCGAWSDLKFPLGWHDFSVRSGDVDSSVQAASVVSFDNVSSVNSCGANTAVVWTLFTWKSVFRPSKRIPIDVQKCVLLFQTEPRNLISAFVHGFFASSSLVTRNWVLFVIYNFAHDEFIFSASSKRVSEHGDRDQVAVGVAAFGLFGRGTVVVPFWEFGNSFWFFG
jgi:hypothetical protein